jgi:hypothetical protein
MLLPSAERAPAKSIVTPPKTTVSDTLLEVTDPVMFSLEKLGRMHARITRTSVDCTWEDMMRFAFTTSALVELPETPEELEVNPKTHGLSVAAFDTGLGALLPPPPLQPTIKTSKPSNKKLRRNLTRPLSRQNGFPKFMRALGISAYG